MICEKCGAPNEPGAQYCGKCAERLPVKSNGNGFADILSYDTKKEPVRTTNNGENKVIERLIKTQKRTIRTQRLSLVIIAIVAVLAIVGLFSPRMDTKRVSDRVMSELNDVVSQQIESWDDEVHSSLTAVDEKLIDVNEAMGTIDSKMQLVNDELSLLEEEIDQLRAASTPSETSEETQNPQTGSDEAEMSPRSEQEYDNPISGLDQENGTVSKAQGDGVEENIEGDTEEDYRPDNLGSIQAP